MSAGASAQVRPPAAVHAFAPPETDEAITNGYDATKAALAWRLARRAIELALADPDALGGVVLHGRHGPARETLLETVARRGPVRRVPADVDAEALVGGLDVGATLAAGRPVHRPGLLERDPGTTLLFGAAERLSRASAATLGTWLDGRRGIGGGVDGAGVDGARVREPSARRPPLVALDESEDGSTLIGSALGERLALHVEVPELALADLAALVADEDGGDDGRRLRPLDPARVAAVILPDETLEEIVRLAERLGIESSRATLHACRAARVAAALDGRRAVETADAALAVQLALAPRARVLPDRTEPEPVAPSEAREPPPSPARGDASSDGEATPSDDEPPCEEGTDEARGDRTDHDVATASPPADERSAPEADEAPGRDEALAERLVEASVAALPARLLDELDGGPPRRRAVGARAAGGGRATRGGRDAHDAAGSRGRPIGTRRPRGRSHASLNLVATLKAAVPFQRLREPPPNAARETAARGRPRLRREDFRVTRFRRPVRTTTVFVVDASGSAAMHRLAEAKGALERLLAECYVRRDRVALISFRGREATLELPPTRSLARAKRTLAGLPGGGGTPLAAGLDAAAELLERLARDGERAVGVLMSDASANVARDGTGSRARATDDALRGAERLARLEARLLFVDTAPRPRPRAAELAARMRARYLALPQLEPALIAGAAR